MGPFPSPSSFSLSPPPRCPGGWKWWLWWTLTECLLCLRHFMCSVSFTAHYNSLRLWLFFLFGRWEKQCPEKVTWPGTEFLPQNHLSKISLKFIWERGGWSAEVMVTTQASFLPAPKYPAMDWMLMSAHVHLLTPKSPLWRYLQGWPLGGN